MSYSVGRLVCYVNCATSIVWAVRPFPQIRLHGRIVDQNCFAPVKHTGFYCRFRVHISICGRERYTAALAMGMAGDLPPETDAFSPNCSAGVPSTRPRFSEVGESPQNPDPRSVAAATPAESDCSTSDQRNSAGAHAEKPLPAELFKGVVLLRCASSVERGYCDIYVVGTAHVSKESCQEVQAIVKCLKPQVVFLELCSKRVAILSPQNLQVPAIRDMVDMWKQKKMNAFGIIYSWFLAKVASQLEVLPGAEFRVGFEEAMKYGGKVVLGDRPVQITLWRTWGKMSLWHKTKFLFHMLFQTVFLPSPDELSRMLKEMDDVDMLSLVIQEMSKEFPTLMDTILHERDMYMSSTLLKVAKEHSSVVAIVGRGHLAGIKKHWEQPVEVEELLKIPVRTPWIPSTMLLTSIGVTVTGVLIISGIYFSLKRGKS